MPPPTGDTHDWRPVLAQEPEEKTGGMAANLVSTIRSFLPMAAKPDLKPAAGKKPVKVPRLPRTPRRALLKLPYDLGDFGLMAEGRTLRSSPKLLSNPRERGTPKPACTCPRGGGPGVRVTLSPKIHQSMHQFY